MIAQEQQVIQRQLREQSPGQLQVGSLTLSLTHSLSLSLCLSLSLSLSVCLSVYCTHTHTLSLTHSLYQTGGVGAQPAALPSQPVQLYQAVAPPPGPPDASAAALSLQTMTLHNPTGTHQAPPLPAKLDHNVAADPRPLSLPPPYQPLPNPAHTQAFQTMPTIPQQPVLYSDPSHAPPTGSHGDASLWGNHKAATSMHPLPSLQLSPASTPPLQHSPMTSVQPLETGPPHVGGAVGVAYSTHSHYQPQQVTNILYGLKM